MSESDNLVAEAATPAPAPCKAIATIVPPVRVIPTTVGVKRQYSVPSNLINRVKRRYLRGRTCQNILS